MQEVDTLSEAQRASGAHDNYMAEIGMDRAGDFVCCSNHDYDMIAVFRVLRGGDEGVEQEGQLKQVSLVRSLLFILRNYSAITRAAIALARFISISKLRCVFIHHLTSSNQLAIGIACKFFVYVDVFQRECHLQVQ